MRFMKEIINKIINKKMKNQKYYYAKISKKKMKTKSLKQIFKQTKNLKIYKN